MHHLKFDFKGKRIFVAGHSGMVGSAIVKRLGTERCELLTAHRTELDLRDQVAVDRWFMEYRPDAVFMAAGKVGGIHANNTFRAEFLYENLIIAANTVHAAYRAETAKFMFLGSSCIYPRLARQPISEEALLTGPLEATNEPYAIAKIAGVKLAENFRRQYGRDFISVMPTNLYGPGDNYHPENSHVAAALLRRFHEAKQSGAREVVVWGTGQPRREFLFVDDLADACVFLMKSYSDDQIINIGTGTDITIAELAKLIAKTVGYHGRIVFDPSRPDGTPQKLLDVSRLTSLGWVAKTPLEVGLAKAYAAFVAQH